MKENKNQINLSNIGRNLKYFRHLSGLSQEKVADRANISLSFYKSLESSNDATPSLPKLMSICSVLQIPLDFIVKDCGVRLFSDYANCEILRQIQSMDTETNKVYSEVLSMIYQQLNQNNNGD